MKPANATWPEYISNGLGWKLSKLGERIGCGWMTYNPVVMGCFHNIALFNAPKVTDSIIKTFPSVKTMVDVGCGSGAIAAEFARRGYKIVGCERSSHGRRLAHQQGVKVIAFDLNQRPPTLLNETFDMAYCFEVAEHLPPILGERLVSFLTQLSSVIVFSAAHPGQGGVGHINEQPLGYWIEKFVARKFEFDQSLTSHLKEGFHKSGASAWFAANVCVFRNKQADHKAVNDL